MQTFEERQALVAAHGGELQPHTNCPRCNSYEVVVAAADPVMEAGQEVGSKARPPKDDDAATCTICGWKDQFKDLIDTVQSGHTSFGPAVAAAAADSVDATEPDPEPAPVLEPEPSPSPPPVADLPPAE